jgi:hypothetical protein
MQSPVQRLHAVLLHLLILLKGILVHQGNLLPRGNNGTVHHMDSPIQVQLESTL